MHPRIKKFWEDTGYEICGPTLIGSYEIYIGNGPIRRIETISHGDSYRFEGNWYSEEEMLRIIKLKVFL